MFLPSVVIWRLPIKFINTAKSTICKNKGPSFQHPLSCKQIIKTKREKKKSVMKDATQEVGKRLECLPPSFTAVTVNPALVLPSPVVITALLLNFAANFKN